MIENATDWRHLALCVEVDPELFFAPAESGPARVAQEVAAKAVCRRCPVLEQCRRWAMTLPYGVAGGLTEDERRALRTRAGAGRKPAAAVGATAREQAAAGRAALRCGGTPAQVSREFGVSERTAQRWARQIEHAPADGGHGGNRAPVLISHTSTQAGTAMEGHRG